MDKELLQLRVSMLQDQSTAQGLQPGAQGCPAEQVPAVPQGLCARAGTLLPARLSTEH